MTVEMYAKSRYTTAMAQLSITLLGGFDVRLDGNPVLGFRSDKVRALLIYLTLETERVHQRAKLAGLLWPDWPEVTALTYLRHALTNLRNLLGDRNATHPFLQVARASVRFNLESQHWFDFRVIAELSLKTPLTDPTKLDRIQQAVALYRGPLLDGFYLDGCPEFEVWLLGMRERLHHQILRGLNQLIKYYEDGGLYEQAQQYAWRYLELERTSEEAHCQLMRLLALSNQRSAALAQFELCRTILAEELGVEPATETLSLYEQIKNDTLIGIGNQQTKTHNSGTNFTMPAPPDLAVRKPSLPTQVMPLIGRKLELAMIASHLQNPDCRLLTLLGPGGIGKTHLAVQAAAEQAALFGNGVYFVALATVGAPESIPPAIAEALKLGFHGVTDSRRQLLNYLRSKQLLLVLDNFEHLLPDVDFINELLEDAPRIKLLVTSRERLNVSAEWLLPVKGLSVPDSSAVHKYVREDAVAKLEEFSAVNLFLRWAVRVHPEFSLHEVDPTQVVQICRLLEGMPLGIQLATGWLRVLSCAQIAERIQANLEFLETTLQDLPVRHRSLKAVFAHSWQLLTTEERNMMTKLAVFRSGFRHEAAQSVASASLKILLALVDKSLLLTSAGGRYQMHELLRQFALAKLAETPAKYKIAHDCFSDYYLMLLHQRIDSTKGISLEQLTEISIEFNNIYEAWCWAIEHERIEIIDQTKFSLLLFIELGGQQVAAFKLIENAAAMLRRKLADPSSLDSAEIRSRISIILTRFLVSQVAVFLYFNNGNKAEKLMLESLVLLKNLDKQATYEIAWSFCMLGWVYHFQGKMQEARAAAQTSLTCFIEQNDLWGKGNVSLLLGYIAYGSGNYQAAEAYFRQNIAEARASRIYGIENYGLRSLTSIARVQGDFVKAQSLLEECYTLQKAQNDAVGSAYSLCSLGHNLRHQKKYILALSQYQASLHVATELGLQLLFESCHYGLGWTYLEIGKYAEAQEHFTENIFAIEQQGVSGLRSAAASYNGLSNVARLEDNDGKAESLCHKALQIAVQIGATPLILDVLLSQALLLHKQQQLARAVEIGAFIQQHPATKHATREKATQLLAEAAAKLSMPEFAQAQQRGAAMQLEDLVNSFLAV